MQFTMKIQLCIAAILAALPDPSALRNPSSSTIDAGRKTSIEKRSINVCSKRNYSRGVGKIHKTCPEGWSNTAGLCYRDCDEDYFASTLTTCQLKCKDAFPVDCGVSYCARSKSDCAKVVSYIAGSVVGGVAALPLIGGALSVELAIAGTGMVEGIGATAFETSGEHGPCSWGRPS